MAVSEGTVETVQRRPEYIETLEKGILDYLFGYDPESGTYSGILGPLGKEKGYFDLPDYQVAPYTDIQKTLLDYVGSEGFQDRYKDYIDTGQQAIDQGIGFFDKASDLVGSGVGTFDPSTEVEKFMNPYTEQVIDPVLKKLDEQGQQALMGQRAKAASRGAFGGSRAGIQEAATEGKIQDAKSDALSKLMASGYDRAMKSALTSFADEQKRRLEAGRLTGGLGSALGGLGGRAGDLGRLYGQLTGADVGLMSGLGGAQQAYEQSLLDAQRKNMMLPLQSALMPAQIGMGYLSGTPSAGLVSQYQDTYLPPANPFLQGIGAYTAIQGLNQS